MLSYFRKSSAYKHWLILVAVCLVYLTFVFQAPFSERSLVGNLGPFPDVFHYVLPARCFILDFSWSLCRPELRGISAEVGPMYSILLIPFYIINSDPRMFYYLNVVLGVISVIMLFKLLEHVTSNQLVSSAISIIAVTSYHIYWLPTLAMAENVILPLFLFSLWLSRYPKSKYFLWFMPFTAICFLLTKFAYVPLSAVFFGYWLYMIVTVHHVISKHLAFALLFVMFSICAWYGFIKTNLGEYFFSLEPTQYQMQHTWFALRFIPDHLSFYSNALFGKPLLVIWDIRPILSMPLSLIGMLGLVLGLSVSKIKDLSWLVIMSLVAQVLFISTFYAADGRYYIIALPALLLGCGLFYKWLEIRSKQVRVLTVFFISAVILTVALQFSTLKSKLAINFKYAETPWYFVATTEIDSSIPKSKDSVLITAIPPYFFDFYTTHSYMILPLAAEQSANKKNLVYGPDFEYSDLNLLYTSLLEGGKKLYISNYGLGNEAYMHEAFERVKNNFELTTVSNGCYEACNLYSVTSKTLNAE